MTYNLELKDIAQNRDMLMQVVSIDGVSVMPNAGTKTGVLSQAGATKFDAVSCPVAAHGQYAATQAEPLCVRRLVMFPSSRVEVWVTYRNAADVPVVAPPCRPESRQYSAPAE